MLTGEGRATRKHLLYDPWRLMSGLFQAGIWNSAKPSRSVPFAKSKKNAAVIFGSKGRNSGQLLTRHYFHVHSPHRRQPGEFCLRL